MKTLENKMNDNDKNIKKVETGMVKETKSKAQKEEENLKLFDNLQESIAL